MSKEELELERQLLAAKRLVAARTARDDFLAFCQLMQPDPTDPDNPDASLFEIGPQHKLFADILHKVEKGELLRVAISLPPRHSKTETFTRLFPAWFAGRDPYRQVMLVGYSQEFSENEFGRKIKPMVDSARYRQVFPRATLRDGSKSVKNLMFDQGGMIASIGAGAALTGRGGDIVVIDDPIANSEDANSASFREKLFAWFSTTAFTRLMPGGRVIIIHTRWHEDDLIGRLVDPNHPEHNPELAKRWTYINVPAVIESERLATALGLELKVPENEDVRAMLGTKPMTALWPSRYGLEFFAEVKRQDERAFSALYQGNPTPEDGEYFKREWFQEYRANELPENLTRYIACDFAISSKEDRDKSAFIAAGVDDKGNIWMLPDIFWGREGDADKLTDEMIRLMKSHKPAALFAESGHISKSIGPFLLQKMRENGLYTHVDDSLVPSKDKATRARPFQGMMSNRRVFWPKFASWYPEAKAELLKFPNGAHDDLVDACAWLGTSLQYQIKASSPKSNVIQMPTVGSIKWMKQDSDFRKKQEKRMKARKGF